MEKKLKNLICVDFFFTRFFLIPHSRVCLDPITKYQYHQLDSILKLIDDEEKEIQVVAAMAVSNLARSGK